MLLIFCTWLTTYRPVVGVHMRMVVRVVMGVVVRVGVIILPMPVIHGNLIRKIFLNYLYKCAWMVDYERLTMLTRK